MHCAASLVRRASMKVEGERCLALRFVSMLHQGFASERGIEAFAHRAIVVRPPIPSKVESEP